MDDHIFFQLSEYKFQDVEYSQENPVRILRSPGVSSCCSHLTTFFCAVCQASAPDLNTMLVWAISRICFSWSPGDGDNMRKLL